MRLLLAALLMLALPALAAAQDRPAHLMTIGYGALVGADIGMTMACVNRGTCKEVNPVLAWAQDRPALFGAVKGGLDTALVLGIYRLTKPRSAARYVGLATLIVGQGVVVALNARALSHVK